MRAGPWGQAAAALGHIFIFFHDCPHHSFFAAKRANTILGYLAGILPCTPFKDWRWRRGS
ncbi:MAG: hypothetical protein COZ12_00045 [Deltaproteobacteria bacterium CG_4_10_14_3_um_filter_60_8]|nr:MAG: hypothetical protein AUK28_00760 [Desulfobacterales bacterium CG2_30_60_27]PIP43399.1 MAG: hypothetical protein COX17_07240 [Deltaproteobacteria bacterium CG23_combo_of_CG06-09_8_20_14_all_60_8]PIY25576.1 MAG: hypothetical protein COZ12_00045 [Deltaproteobacteria bacterium CG_4_10_14_3_um_filter_60_8]